MIIDFERCKTTIGGRWVTITSWYDETAATWRASAPAYSYLSASLQSPASVFASRKDAITRLKGDLTRVISDEQGGADRG